MTDRLRMAVVGAGHLGRHHARILSELPGVELVRVVDTNADRAAEIAAQTNTRPATSLEEILERVDAVTVATPTASHLHVARRFLEAGIPVLVEKPIAQSVEAADELIRTAGRSGVLLSVGHTERYNPAVSAARPFVRDPRFVEIHRLGTFPERSLDIDVVFDLMIHDLDIVLSLVPSDIVAIDAVGVPVLTGRVDIANARLRFASGCIVNLTASRISRDRLRKLRLFQQDTYLSIDYAAQEVEVWRLVRSDGERPVIDGGKVEVVRDEPLKLELTDFVDAVRSRRPPVVTADAGRRALSLAEEITTRMRIGS